MTQSFTDDPLSMLIHTSRILSGEVSIRPRTVCADGFSMSVQASAGHYCTPRVDDGPWSAAEVGYPSAVEEALLPYAEEPGRPTDTVYGYVPTEIIEAVIERHGGVVGLDS